MRTALEDYIKQYNLKALIIGESGGIDSALTTVLAQPVCQKLNISLIGRSISIETNTQDEIDRGKYIGEAFCTDFQEIDLTNLYKATLESIEETPKGSTNKYDDKIRFGNIKARLRMIYLYNLAQKHKGLVLGTDNYTEYLEGFWTLHGDVGDFGMIQNLWKTEVYEMSNYLIENELKDNKQKSALQKCVDALPTDGLGITNSDLEQLEAKDYTEVDTILKEYFENPEKHKNHKVIQRHLNSCYKRNNPYNISREELY